jgi:hypothetical protein
MKWKVLHIHSRFSVALGLEQSLCLFKTFRP